MSYPILDLYVLKVITSSENHSIQFSRSYKQDLFVEPLQRFAKYILSHIKAYQSLPTKRALIERNCNDDNVDEYVNDVFEKLDDLEYDIKDYPLDLESIKRRWTNDSVLKIKDIIIDEEADPSGALKKIELAVQSIKSINEGQSYIQRTVQDHTELFREELKAKEADETLSMGILTHYSAIDYVTNGFKKSDMFVIGGETGSGKSTLLNNIAIQMWMQNNTFGTPSNEYTKGYNVLYFSLEMPYDQCFNRTMARMANVPQMSLMKAKMTGSEKDRVDMALSFIDEYPYQFQIVDIPRGVTIDHIETRYHEAKMKFEPDVVIVDYLGLMDEPKSSSSDDWLKLGHIAGSLHEFSRAHNVVLGTAVQLTDIKRGMGAKSRDQQVGVHRVGRSSHIMHHATLGIQIVTRPDEASFDDMELESIKNRNGPKMSASIGRNFANALLIDRPYLVDSGSGQSKSIGGDLDLTTLLNKPSTNNVESDSEDD